MALGEFDGNGNYDRLFRWMEHFEQGIGIEPDLHDQEDDAFANALSNCMTRDGQSPATAPIPLGGQRLVDVGDPTAADDAATRGFIESSSLYERKTALRMTGSGANGRINFEFPSGVNGIGWAGIDMSFVGKLAEVGKWDHRLVFNKAYAANGADVVIIHENGHMNVPWLETNLVLEGGVWRNIAAGSSLALGITQNRLDLWGQNTAATSAFQTAPIRNFATILNNAGTAVMQLSKTGTGDSAIVRGMVGQEARWDMYLGNTTAEAGGATGYTGNDFVIYGYNNSGDLPKLAMRIDRADMAVTFGGEISVTAPGGVRAGAGLFERAGSGGAYGTQYMNLWFQGPGDTRVYADTTLAGQVPAPCDYRIKQDVRNLTSTWDKVKQLKPVAFQYADYEIFKADGKERWGFIAHELQEALLPTAATGEKDAKDLQSPDPWALIAALTSALQEAMVRIERLEGKL